MPNGPYTVNQDDIDRSSTLDAHGYIKTNQPPRIPRRLICFDVPMSDYERQATRMSELVLNPSQFFGVPTMANRTKQTWLEALAQQ